MIMWDNGPVYAEIDLKSFSDTFLLIYYCFKEIFQESIESRAAVIVLKLLVLYRPIGEF